MWPKNAPPYPVFHNDGRPRWNTIHQCTEHVFQKNNKPYPRGNIDPHDNQYHLFHYHSMTQALQNVFGLFINFVSKADDHNLNVLYIERFLFMPQEVFELLIKWLKSATKYSIKNSTQIYKDMEISRHFIIKSRRVTVWHPWTWDNVRGEVACQYYYSKFWNDSLLKKLCIKYLSKHPKSAFHNSIVFTDKDIKITQEITKMIDDKENSFNTSFKIVSLAQWNLKKYTNNSPDEVIYCPTIIWLAYDLPKTLPGFGNVPQYRRNGNIKNGTMTRLLPRLPEPCISVSTMDKILASKEYHKDGVKVFEILRNHVTECVC